MVDDGRAGPRERGASIGKRSIGRHPAFAKDAEMRGKV
jgi:hypothetical protein